jgi:putative ABC transport system permease protein
MRQVASDLRDAARALRRRPGFALLAVLTLAVGMSVNTVAFSVVNAVLFKQPIFPDSARLGWIFIGTKGNPLGEASWPDYEHFRDRSATLDAVIAEGRLPLRLREGNRSEQIWSLVVSSNYFTVLGVRAEAGRLLTTADASHPVAVVSHAFWKARLRGEAPGNLTLLLNDQPFAVVGVLPPGFQGPGGIYSPDVWVSLDARDLLGLRQELRDPSHDWLTLVGRRSRGPTPAGDRRADASRAAGGRVLGGRPPQRAVRAHARRAPGAAGPGQRRCPSRWGSSASSC